MDQGFCESLSGETFEISLERHKETVWISPNPPNVSTFSNPTYIKEPVGIIEGARESLDVRPLEQRNPFLSRVRGS